MPDKENNEHEAFLSALFAALAEAGECYCVLRNWQGLPQSCGNDLDLFVANRHCGRFAGQVISVAAQNGYVLCSQMPKYGYRSFDFMQWSSRKRLKIDMFTDIHFRGLALMDSDEVLKGLRQHGGILVASPAVESFINLTKDVLDSGLIKAKYRAAVKETLHDEHQGEKLRQLLEKALGAPGRDLVLHHLGADAVMDADMLGQLRRAFRNRHYLRNPLKSLLRQARAALERLSARRKAARSTRLTIALLGPDGSGKSTVSQMLLEKLVPPEHNVVYRHGRPGIIPDLRQIVNALRRFGGRVPLAANPKGEKADHGKLHRPLLASIYVIYYGLDFWLDHISSRFNRQWNLRVFDRYWYDYFFLPSFARLPSILHAWQYFLPKANLLLVLMADSETIFARKPELAIAQIETQNARARQLAAWRGEARIIPTGVTVQETLTAVALEIGKMR